MGPTLEFVVLPVFLGDFFCQCKTFFIHTHFNDCSALPSDVFEINPFEFMVSIQAKNDHETKLKSH